MILAEVPYRSNGKSIQFFDDHVEFKGQSFRYDDIATLVANGSSTTHTYFGIPLARSFDGVILFTLNNGKRHSINMNSLAMFGIPIIRNPRKSEELFPPLFDAVNSIVAWNMAQKCINAIKGGATVEVAGLTINSIAATSTAKLTKKVTVINRENYRESLVMNYSKVAVFGRLGDLLWESFWSNKNILLIPYILDAIFG